MKVVFKLFVIEFIMFCFLSNIYSQSDECDISNEWSILIPDTNANQGECICIPVIGYNFEGLTAIEVSMCWDETILEYKSLNEISLTGGAYNDNNAGEILYLWTYLADLSPQFLNGQVLFELCFAVIGQECNASEILLDCSNNSNIEIFDSDLNIVDYCLDNGTFTVGNIANCPNTCSATNGTIQIKINE